MKMFYILATLSLLISVRADLTQYITDLPQCGLQCILESVRQSTCGLTNSTCICTDHSLAAATNICLAQNCTVIESLQVANISNLSCGGGVPSRQDYLISTSGLGVVAFLAVLVRLFSRLKFERTLKMDDWSMAFIGLCLVVFCVLGVMAAVYGFVGRRPRKFDQGPEGIFHQRNIYIAILGLCKISVLLFFLRIFPSDNFKKICYCILGWVAVCTIVLVLCTAFQCIPVAYNWLGWIGTEKPARCTDLNALTYASSSINLAQDVIILILPFPWLLRLNIGWKRKLNVLFMFSLGLFICITSIIRLTKIVKFRATTNPTWDYISTTYWSAIETYVLIIVPSLPAIRSLLSHRFPKLFSIETQNSKRYNYEQSQPPQHSYKMTSSSKSTTIASSSNPGAESADYFPDSKLKLGDKLKGTVHTGVSSGRRSSDEELVGSEEIIVVSTEIRAENRGSSAHSWLEDDEISSKSYQEYRRTQPGEEV